MIRASRKRTDWDAVKATLRTAQQALEATSTVSQSRIAEILHERAERLAAGDSRNETTATTVPVVVFKEGDEALGIELGHVAQVFPDTPVTPVPGAPQALLGVANLQGNVRPVFGLQRLLPPRDSDADAARYILLLRRGNSRAGLQIEHIDGIRQLDLGDLIELEETPSDAHAAYVQGMTRDRVLILKTDWLFED